VVELPGFESGDFWVQDAAAALPALLLAARPGERVADLCAAPGGKTAQLAASGAQVVAVERDPSRMKRLRENLARLLLTADLVQADAASWAPAEKFDAVLLDAPCSATGTMRRHPDVAHIKKPGDIVALAAGQAALLQSAAALLKPGGRLIYAVCSMQPEEGPAHCVSAGLAASPFSAEEMAAIPQARTASGTLRTHPGLWPELGGMDGFYAARFIKPA
jgi:16S rRNA (cytosine967-C5)-methyltransferase